MVPVYPSNDDDVITSPYNTVLAMNQITEHANCVVPVEVRQQEGDLGVKKPHLG